MNEIRDIIAENAQSGGSAVYVAGLLVLVVASVLRLPYAVAWGKRFVFGVGLASFALLVRIGQWYVAGLMRPSPEHEAAEWILTARPWTNTIGAFVFMAGVAIALSAVVRHGSVQYWLTRSAVCAVLVWSLGVWLASLTR